MRDWRAGRTEGGGEGVGESAAVFMNALLSTSNGLCYKLYYYESRIMALAERPQVG